MKSFISPHQLEKMRLRTFKWFFASILFIQANTAGGNPLQENPKEKHNPFASLLRLELPTQSPLPTPTVKAAPQPMQNPEPQKSPLALKKTDRQAPPAFPKNQSSQKNKKVTLTGIVSTRQERFAVFKIGDSSHIVLAGEVFLGRQVLEIQKDQVIVWAGNRPQVLEIQKGGTP